MKKHLLFELFSLVLTRYIVDILRGAGKLIGAEKNTNDFEKIIKEYLNQGKQKLLNDLSGTREAIKLIADDRVRDFIMTADKGLDKEERSFLGMLIVSSMYQSFCYGYGIGKIEEYTSSTPIMGS